MTSNQRFKPGLVSEMYSCKGLEITFGNDLHKIDNSTSPWVPFKDFVFVPFCISEIAFRIIFFGRF